MRLKFKWCVCLGFFLFNSLSGTPHLYNTPTSISEEDLPTYSYESSQSITTSEKILITHVKSSIAKAEMKQSQISSDILKLDGMSSDKVRHFLNNVCSLSHAKYLEIGVWKGSTFVSALYQNQDTIDHAVSIDNWCAFNGPKEEFAANCTRFLAKNDYKFYSTDCFTIDPTTLTSDPINIYFYDGDHRYIDQKMAFEHYDKIFDRAFIAIVDDWNCENVKNGTYKAFDELSYEILYEAALPAKGNGDRDQWWNGLYVAVIRKY